MLYLQEPKNFQPDFDIVSLYLECQGKILLLHRNPSKPQGGKWGVPAGKVDNGEELVPALVREVFEETGVSIGPGELEYFQSVYVEHPEHHFVYHMYHLAMVDFPDVVTSEYEHQRYQWVSPKDALKLDLVDDLDTCIHMYYFTGS